MPEHEERHSGCDQGTCVRRQIRICLSEPAVTTNDASSTKLSNTRGGSKHTNIWGSKHTSNIYFQVTWSPRILKVLMAVPLEQTGALGLIPRSAGIQGARPVRRRLILSSGILCEKSHTWTRMINLRYKEYLPYHNKDSVHRNPQSSCIVGTWTLRFMNQPSSAGHAQSETTVPASAARISAYVSDCQHPFEVCVRHLILGKLLPIWLLWHRSPLFQ